MRRVLRPWWRLPCTSHKLTHATILEMSLVGYVFNDGSSECTFDVVLQIHFTLQAVIIADS